MNKLHRILALLAVLAMIAAACGGSSDDGDAASSDADTETSDSDDEAMEDDDEAMEDDGEAMADGELVTGPGVTDDEINIGLLSDLTGIFAGLTVPITDGNEAYFERLNANGGIAGRTISTVTLDTAYDVPTHQQHYDTMSGDGNDAVAMIGMSVGSPHTASIREDLVDDEIAAIPVSWNSSWAAEDGSNVLEWGVNYCVEAMNGVDYLANALGGTTLAIVSFPGDYGEDGALGAKMAADALGIEVVYDGQAAVIPGADQTPVITEIVASGADIVWTTVNPTTLAELMGGVAAAGQTPQWAGNGPSFSPLLLNTALAPLLDTNYTHFSPNAAFGVDGDGAADIRAMMREFRPDAPHLSVYAISWIQGEIVRQTLEAAVENGHLTRAGIVEAAQSITYDMQGVIPNFSYAGDANDNLIRSSYVFDVTVDTFNADATVLDDDGEGITLVDPAYTSSVAEGFEYAPCFGI